MPEEASAKRALHDPAIMAGHAFINKRTENIDLHIKALTQIIGSPKEPIDLVIADNFQRKEITAMSHYDETQS